MKAAPWTRSFKTRIVLSYSLILILGGASTTSIGVWVTGAMLRKQARRDTEQCLSVARWAVAGALRDGGAADSAAVVSEIHRVLFAPASDDVPAEGAVSLLKGDRIVATAPPEAARRLSGWRLPAEDSEAVLRRGDTRLSREFDAGAWRNVAVAPLLDASGTPVGALRVETLERPYMVMRDNLTASFLAIAILCFVLIVVVTYFLTRSLVRPLDEMVSAARQITAGDLSPRVRVDGHAEFEQLGRSFNEMLDRIHTMTRELEDWAACLEARVEQRTRELDHARAQMARSDRLAAVGRLAAGVAHEINNPLGGVLTFATLALEGLPADDRRRGDLEEIVRQAVRCREIVAELLEFSRPREPHMRPENLNSPVSRALALLEKQAAFHNITIERRLAPRLADTRMDASQMEQVLMNVILNAADAMGERGTLTVRTWDEDAETCVEISDTGCGIPPEQIDAIFDPFYTTKPPGQGTGLGLAVAHRIVSDHGGHIEVKSRPGLGTSLTVRLPHAGRSSDSDSRPL